MEKRLSKTRIRAGAWHGVLAGAAIRPQIEVLHLGAPVLGVVVEAMPDGQTDWHITIPIPQDALSEGVQTFVILEAGTVEPLGQFTLILGVEVEDDLRAEVDLLRQELDMLKRAFRRHFHEARG